MAAALGTSFVYSATSPSSARSRSRAMLSRQLCSNGSLLFAAGGVRSSTNLAIHSAARPAECEYAGQQPEGGSVNTADHSAGDLQRSEGGQRSRGAGNSMLLQASPLSLVALAALPGADQVTALIEPWAEVVRGMDLPGWLVHWGHPGNMAVVLFAMGGYGSWLGWQIRLSDDATVKAKAKDAHPKILAGLFFFFAAGAAGGVTSLITTGKPIFESPHALTGFIGLGLLTIQTILPALFEGNPSIRGVHAWFGSGIMALFLVHAALGLQLGLSY